MLKEMGKDVVSLEKAEELIDEDEIKDAIDVLEEIIDDDEEDYKAWTLLIETLIDEGELEDAAEAMEGLKEVIEEHYEEDDRKIRRAINDYEDFKEDILDEDDEIEIEALILSTTSEDGQNETVVEGSTSNGMDTDTNFGQDDNETYNHVEVDDVWDFDPANPYTLLDNQRYIEYLADGKVNIIQCYSDLGYDWDIGDSPETAVDVENDVKAYYMDTYGINVGVFSVMMDNEQIHYKVTIDSASEYDVFAEFSLADLIEYYSGYHQINEYWYKAYNVQSNEQVAFEFTEETAVAYANHELLNLDGGYGGIAFEGTYISVPGNITMLLYNPDYTEVTIIDDQMLYVSGFGYGVILYD
jgi:tetratricopeptide (TPR) repeat protein